MMQESTAATARAILEAAGQRNPEALAAFYRDDVVVEWLPVGRFEGKQAVLGFWKEIFASVPDSRVELLSEVSEGDTAVLE